MKQGAAYKRGPLAMLGENDVSSWWSEIYCSSLVFLDYDGSVVAAETE